MKTWKDITLYQFQQVSKKAADSNISDIDRALFSACIVYDLTEYQLDSMPPKKALKLINQVNDIFSSDSSYECSGRIGRYRMSMDVSSIKFGQYIDLSFFLQDPFGKGEHLQRAHYSLASMSHTPFRKYTADRHKDRAEYFLKQPASITIGCLQAIMDNLKSFNGQFGSLFGLDDEIYDKSARSDAFYRRYGWTYSAYIVAEYERIPLEQAYDLPVRQALNDLSYLKEKSRYDAEQHKKMIDELKNQNNGR